MATLASLLAALQAADKEAQRVNPYATMANTFDLLGPTIVKASPGRSTSDVIKAGLLSGALSGLGSHFSEGYQTRQRESALDTLLKGIQGADVERPRGMAPSVFRTVQDFTGTYNLADQLADADYEREAQRQTDLIMNRAIASQPHRADQIRAAFGKGAVVEEEPIVREPRTPTSGPRSYEDRLLDMTEKIMDRGNVTPNEAMTRAAQALAPDRRQMDRSLKLVDDIRTQADEMSSLAEQSRLAVEGAGQTGGGPLVSLPRDALSWMYSWINPEEATQRSKTATLEGLGADIIKASRPPGVGAMSDAEMKKYLAAGVSDINRPETNFLIIEKLENVAQAQHDYADFREWYIDSYGTDRGAHPLWKRYKQDHPLLIRDKGGELQYDRDRKSWRDWMLDGPPDTKTTTEPTAQPTADQARLEQTSVRAEPQPTDYNSPEAYINAYRAWESGNR